MSQKELISKFSFEYKTLIPKSTGFRAFSKFVEQSTFYDDQKLELLQKCEDCIFEIKQEQLKQKKIIDFFKKTTLRN